MLALSQLVVALVPSLHATTGAMLAGQLAPFALVHVACGWLLAMVATVAIAMLLMHVIVARRLWHFRSAQQHVPAPPTNTVAGWLATGAVAITLAGCAVAWLWFAAPALAGSLYGQPSARVAATAIKAWVATVAMLAMAVAAMAILWHWHQRTRRLAMTIDEVRREAKAQQAPSGMRDQLRQRQHQAPIDPAVITLWIYDDAGAVGLGYQTASRVAPMILLTVTAAVAQQFIRHPASVAIVRHAPLLRQRLTQLRVGQLAPRDTWDELAAALTGAAATVRK
jgi:flagellar biosynthesis protein FlhB